MKVVPGLTLRGYLIFWRPLSGSSFANFVYFLFGNPVKLQP
jgi:hypothetical protein